MEVARLSAEVLRAQNADARDALILFASDREDAAPLFLGIGKCAHSDMDFSLAERWIPGLWVVGALVPELRGARRHPDAERLGETLQRVARNAERLEARIADPDEQPGIVRAPPARGGIDMRRQSAEEFATRSSIVDAQEHMRAEVRSRPLPEDGRLDFMQVERRRVG